ncbi:major facilitator superfamily domain-containing protein [Plectosphaerella cucumerina]|uniref:Major facilitator superfamily domain-containing protein n=1 Tax=Plectosphaerella cucumerina TaxID=40658 RepID=A0A8K0TJV6_9PEZI|nr:major facilitator superfamily domain-containing protein [Plectosphaerella cucumerina]
MAPSINEKIGGLAECDEHAAKDGTLVSQPITYIDPAEEKALVKKLDRVIMPVMAVVYFFQYLDKQSINYAAVFGLSEDLNLTGSEFSWAISLFYFGQLCSEYPAAYLMSRLPITVFVGITIVLWGGVEMCLGASKDFASLAATRFLLGFTEGAVSPSFMIITSNWYKRSEHPVRISTWVSMFGVSQIAGGLMMYGIGSGVHAIATWRVMFMVCGGLTIAAGIGFIFLMPRNTTTAWFLNEREREIATARLALDRATRDRAHFDWAQVKEAFTDPRTALFAAMAFFITLPTPIVKFSSLVINGFGYSKFQTMLVGLPSGAIAFCLVWVGGLGPRFFPGTRCFFGIFLAIVPMLCSIMLLTLPANYKWGIVASTWLAGSTAPPLGQVVGLMASNVKGNTKKSVVSAIFFVFYCIGCIVGPQLWQKKEAPRYSKGCTASIVSFGCLIVAFVVHYLTAKRTNRKRDGTNVEGEGDAGLSTDSDLTERQDKGFRYTY